MTCTVFVLMLLITFILGDIILGELQQVCESATRLHKRGTHSD